MTRTFRTLLLLTLFLSACSAGLPSPSASPPTLAAGAKPEIQTSVSTGIVPTADTAPALTEESPSALTMEVLPPATLAPTLATPQIGQPPVDATTPVSSYPQDCGYQWAYQDLPELSGSFLQSTQALQPGAQALAFGFGENCVHADGSATFLPMETDFNVTLQAGDLTDEAALGEWIVKVMQVIESIPPDQIIGPRPGRVSILFESNGERKGVNFYIDQYRALAAGLSFEEIYHTLQAQQ